jgi:hypothetical protein
MTRKLLAPVLSHKFFYSEILNRADCFMKNIALLILICTFTLSCEQKKKEKTNDTTSGQIRDNDLNESQKAEGWKILFDGISMEGWAFYKNLENNSWEVIDGTLHCKPFDSAMVRSDLKTTSEFKDFELTFDWKLAHQSNSGVMYRVSEEFNEAFFTGPEYQILDDAGFPGDIQSWQSTGSCFGMYTSPASKKINPLGQWNTSKIVVKGNHIEHWLNSDKLFEYEINSAEWKKLKSEGKWKDEPQYGQKEKGFIVLQDHKSEAWFKNIFIKQL